MVLEFFYNAYYPWIPGTLKSNSDTADTLKSMSIYTASPHCTQTHKHSGSAIRTVSMSVWWSVCETLPLPRCSSSTWGTSHLCRTSPCGGGADANNSLLPLAGRSGWRRSRCGVWSPSHTRRSTMLKQKERKKESHARKQLVMLIGIVLVVGIRGHLGYRKMRFWFGRADLMIFGFWKDWHRKEVLCKINQYQ